MCDFSRVSAWLCDEKISLKKSCFYLYIRRGYCSSWTKAIIGRIGYIDVSLYYYKEECAE